MDVDLDRLTAVLAGRLGAIVPAGIHVEAAAGMLWYSADQVAGRSGTHVAENFHTHGHTDEQRLVGVAAQALDELQDYVDEVTTEPWPGERTPPQPHAQVRHEMLHMWYGSPDHDRAVLACEPIPLAELSR